MGVLVLERMWVPPSWCEYSEIGANAHYFHMVPSIHFRDKETYFSVLAKCDEFDLKLKVIVKRIRRICNMKNIQLLKKKYTHARTHTSKQTGNILFFSFRLVVRALGPRVSDLKLSCWSWVRTSLRCFTEQEALSMLIKGHVGQWNRTRWRIKQTCKRWRNK